MNTKNRQNATIKTDERKSEEKKTRRLFELARQCIEDQDYAPKVWYTDKPNF